MNTKMLCLGVLSLGQASGYDIGKQLEQIFGNFIDVATSGVYPALKALHEEGLVSFDVVTQEALPNKKVYAITDEGRRVFREALNQLAPRHRIRSQFVLLLFYAELLASERLEAILDERETELRQWRDMTAEWVQMCQQQEEDAHAGRHFIARMALTVMEAELDFLEANREQLAQDLQNQRSSANEGTAGQGSPGECQ